MPTWPGTRIVVHAIDREGGKVEFLESSGTWNIEWYLVQNDIYGNPRALMEVGNGPVLRLDVPWNPEFYDLRMVVHNGEISRHILHSIVLPVHPSQEDRYVVD